MTEFVYSFSVDVPPKHLDEIAFYSKIGPALTAFAETMAAAGHPIEWTRSAAVAPAPVRKRGPNKRTTGAAPVEFSSEPTPEAAHKPTKKAA